MLDCVPVEPLGCPWPCRRGLGDGVCPRLLEWSDVRNVTMKKLWIEDILGVTLHWWQRVVLWPRDREAKKRYDVLRYYVQLSPSTAEELERRDKFFQQLHEELSCKMDGADFVEEIPDIDLEE